MMVSTVKMRVMRAARIRGDGGVDEGEDGDGNEGEEEGENSASEDD